MPIIDSPQYLQLHSALDTFSCLPFAVASLQSSSSVFWLDREVMTSALSAILADSPAAEEDARRRRIREITEEGWDVFLRVLADGALVVQAVAVRIYAHDLRPRWYLRLNGTVTHYARFQNIDRRPPTLLKHFTLLETAPGTLPGPPRHLYVVPSPTHGSLTLLTSPPLAAYELSLLSFFGARDAGLRHIASGTEHVHPMLAAVDDPRSEIVRYVRTPNGEGVGAIRADGSGEVWTFDWAKTGALEKTGEWSPQELGHVDHFVVLDAGLCLRDQGRVPHS